MRTPEDALRSYRRWWSVLMPEPWDIRLSRDEIERPAVFVQPASPQTNTGSAYIRDQGADFDAFAYPTGIEGSSVQSRREAESLRQRIDLAMTRGLKLVSGEYYSFSMRVPAYDYTGTEVEVPAPTELDPDATELVIGVPWDMAMPEDVDPYDFFVITNWALEVRIDPDDDTLFTVVASARLNWRTVGDIRHTEGAVLQDVIVSHP